LLQLSIQNKIWTTATLTGSSVLQRLAHTGSPQSLNSRNKLRCLACPFKSSHGQLPPVDWVISVAKTCSHRITSIFEQQQQLTCFNCPVKSSYGQTQPVNWVMIFAMTPPPTSDVCMLQLVKKLCLIGISAIKQMTRPLMTDL